MFPFLDFSRLPMKRHPVRLQRVWLAVAMLALVPFLGLVGCGREGKDGKVDVTVDPAKVRQSNVQLPKVYFTDITAKAGIKFVHTSGANLGKRLLPETMGSGVAFCDF